MQRLQLAVCLAALFVCPGDSRHVHHLGPSTAAGISSIRNLAGARRHSRSGLSRGDAPLHWTHRASDTDRLDEHIHLSSRTLKQTEVSVADLKLAFIYQDDLEGSVAQSTIDTVVSNLAAAQAAVEQIIKTTNAPPGPLLIVPACLAYISAEGEDDLPGGLDVCIAPFWSPYHLRALSGGYMKEMTVCDIDLEEATDDELDQFFDAIISDNQFITDNCVVRGGPGDGTDANIVFHVTIGSADEEGDCDASTLAYVEPMHSYLNQEMLEAGLLPSLRPVVASLTICPASLEDQPTRLQETLIHEILHGLGMPMNYETQLFEELFEARGDAFPDTAGNVSEIVTLRGTEREVQISPRVLKEVRAQFGCADLPGAEWELQGGDGSAGAHWEDRMFRYDLMTAASVEYNKRELENEAGEVDALRVSASRTTLAYLEDTGFYTANYDLAGFQKWGWQEGCSFALQDCGDWAKDNPGQTHFCENPTLEADDYDLDITDLENSVSDLEGSSIGQCVWTEPSPEERCGVTSLTYSCISTTFADRFPRAAGPTNQIKGQARLKCTLPDQDYDRLYDIPRSSRRVEDEAACAELCHLTSRCNMAAFVVNIKRCYPKTVPFSQPAPGARAGITLVLPDRSKLSCGPAAQGPKESSTGAPQRSVSQNGLTSRAVAAIGVAFAADTGLLPGLTPTNPRGQPWTGGLCAPLSCKADGSLQVTLDNQTFTCATGSSVALADLPGSRFAAGSIINCPDTALMCSADYSQMDKYGELTCGALNHCSGGGECYKGTCYCFVGRTGCDCALSSESLEAQSHDPASCNRWIGNVFSGVTPAPAGVAEA